MTMTLHFCPCITADVNAATGVRMVVDSLKRPQLWTQGGEYRGHWMWARGHPQLCYLTFLRGVHTRTSQPAAFFPRHGSTCPVTLQTGSYCLLPSTDNGQRTDRLVLQLPGSGLRGIFSHLLEVPRDTELQLPQWELACKHTFHWLTSLPVSPPFSLATVSWDHCQIITGTPILVSHSAFGGNLNRATWGSLPHNPLKLPLLTRASSYGLTSRC